MKTVYKHPDELLDYVFDWSDWLAEVTDAIQASVWDVPDGLTLVQDEHSTESATAWIAGGADGSAYTVRNSIETAEGRRATRSLLLVVTTAK